MRSSSLPKLLAQKPGQDEASKVAHVCTAREREREKEREREREGFCQVPNQSPHCETRRLGVDLISEIISEKYRLRSCKIRSGGDTSGKKKKIQVIWDASARTLSGTSSLARDWSAREAPSVAIGVVCFGARASAQPRTTSKKRVHALHRHSPGAGQNGRTTTLGAPTLASCSRVQ
ncbi:hypothetical protein C0J52_09974 [Blattella germanica]|nr:hypothetical protein C0J52_09974 [Blattella germanica]